VLIYHNSEVEDKDKGFKCQGSTVTSPVYRIRHISKLLGLNNEFLFCIYSAAAHNKLNNNDQALNDCFRSIEIDPNYSKAYGRLG
jgi:small glutamine-rich tetratricopeptide repeat-containing protein alpha